MGPNRSGMRPDHSQTLLDNFLENSFLFFHNTFHKYIIFSTPEAGNLCKMSATFRIFFRSQITHSSNIFLKFYLFIPLFFGFGCYQILGRLVFVWLRVAIVWPSLLRESWRYTLLRIQTDRASPRDTLCFLPSVARCSQAPGRRSKNRRLGLAQRAGPGRRQH